MSFKVEYDRDGIPKANTTMQAQVAPSAETYKTVFDDIQQQEKQAAAPTLDNQSTVIDNLETTDEPTTEIEVNEPQVASKQTETRATQEEGYQARNFRELREEKQRADRERDEAIIKLRVYEQQQQMQQQQAPIAPEPDEDFDVSIAPDEIAEGKHVKKLIDEVKRLKSMVKQTEQRSTVMSEEAKLLAKYPDYYKVVTQENIARLQAEDPELAQILGTSTDIYGAKAMAYKAISKSKATTTTEKSYDLEKQLIQKNAAKPKPLASLSPQQGDSALSRANAFANGLTPELQKQLRMEMEMARRNN